MGLRGGAVGCQIWRLSGWADEGRRGSTRQAVLRVAQRTAARGDEVGTGTRRCLEPWVEGADRAMGCRISGEFMVEYAMLHLRASIEWFRPHSCSDEFHRPLNWDSSGSSTYVESAFGLIMKFMSSSFIEKLKSGGFGMSWLKFYGSLWTRPRYFDIVELVVILRRFCLENHRA
ncbi:uncharacterized protein A4U43_C01F27240 [Asparagus officinalis]|uniref:Uncharacterized protein n=1 Tax=Asparagus officinalis TaxID=4686 RepID=A0A5P1FT51_ASPOF|nr:uncharacterized protein A4U43_C01F27240 [Asparagus officinalis]